MKVLTLSTGDVEGGAARAAYRLHTALQQAGVTTNMLVQTKAGDDPMVLGPGSVRSKLMSRLRPTLDHWPVRRYEHNGDIIFSPGWLPFSDLIGRINAADADVVHLHWVQAGMLNIADLARIRQPIVWSLHDMWAFTGGCHYDAECGRYTTHCGKCPVLGSRQERDLSHRVFQRKMKALRGRKDVTIVGLSRWLADRASKSTLFRDLRVVNLPNPIDTRVYRPVDKQWARTILGLPLDRKLMLFGGYKATGDPRKGFAHLLEALKLFKMPGVELLVIGARKPADPPDLGFPTHYMGSFQDDVSLNLLYNAADLVVVPSLQENLSNAIMESLACGTPVAAFDIGGNKDLIDHAASGWLASPFEPADLAKGMQWALGHPDPTQVASTARRKVLDVFAMDKVAQRYIELYQEVVAAKT